MLPAIFNCDPGDETSFSPPESVKCPDCNVGIFVKGQCTECKLSWEEIENAAHFILGGAPLVQLYRDGHSKSEKV